MRNGSSAPQGFTCPDCGDTTELGQVTHTSAPPSGPIIVEHVPALVCPQCGYTAFPLTSFRALERLIAERPEPARYATVPVYDLSGLAGDDTATPAERAGR